MIENIIKANNVLAVDLLRKLSTQSDNVFFSPFSVLNCLAIAYAGARGNTEREIAKILHLPSKGPLLHQSFKDLHRRIKDIQSKKSLVLKVANALWIQPDYKIKKDFVKLSRNYYGSGVFFADYKKDLMRCRLRINRWIAKQTKDKIRDILQPGMMNDLTRRIIANAIYFRGNWQNQFATFDTKDDIFMKTPEKKLEVKMMYQKADFGYKETIDLQVLEMPYVGKELSMVILLPKELDGLSELEERLSPDILKEWISNLDHGEVRVFIPKFEIKAKYTLNSVLNSLGMEDAFTKSADFSGMGEKMNNWISEIVHETFIKVYEEGTEAVAATAAYMIWGVSMGRIPGIRADHPFFFVIRENRSENIIFIGKVLEPKEKNHP